MNYVWYRNVPAGPELTEMLIDKRGFAGTRVACTRARCRTATSTR